MDAFVTRRRAVRWWLMPLALVAIWLIGVAPAAALETRRGDVVVVAPDEVVDDDLSAIGSTIAIAGRVVGDVYAAGQRITVSGTVEGDLIAAAETVEVTGQILGSVRAAGASVHISGQVGRNATLAARTVRLESRGRLDGSLLAFAGSTLLAGQVGRGVALTSGDARLAGPVGGDVRATASQLAIQPGARIAGNLHYSSDAEAVVPPNTVAGQVFREESPRRAWEEQLAEIQRRASWVLAAAWVLGSLLVGALVMLIAPRAGRAAVAEGRARPLSALAVGLAGLVGAPVLAAIAAITLVGLPLALLLLGIWLVGAFLGWMLTGVVLGAVLVQLVQPESALPHPALLAVIGLAVLALASYLPYVGGLIGFAAAAFGVGLLLVLLWRARRGQPTPASAFEDTPPPLPAAEPIGT